MAKKYPVMLFAMKNDAVPTADRIHKQLHACSPTSVATDTVEAQPSHTDGCQYERDLRLPIVSGLEKEGEKRKHKRSELVQELTND